MARPSCTQETSASHYSVRLPREECVLPLLTFLIPPDSFESPYGAPAACSVGCTLSQQFLQSALMHIAAACLPVPGTLRGDDCGTNVVDRLAWLRKYEGGIKQWTSARQKRRAGSQERKQIRDTIRCFALRQSVYVPFSHYLQLLRFSSHYSDWGTDRVHVSYRIYSTSYENDQRSPSGAVVMNSWSYTSTARKLPTLLA